MHILECCLPSHLFENVALCPNMRNMFVRLAMKLTACLRHTMANARKNEHGCILQKPSLGVQLQEKFAS